MKANPSLRQTLGACTALLAAWAPLVARADEASDEPITVVVRGVRESLATAQGTKRSAGQIVDSIVADDISKLPDASVSEALQRITGVQIARDRGEGTSVTVRGLTQLETTLNGREVFSASRGRQLDFATVPAELVSRLDVYKSSSAIQLEGGVGGLIDLQTRRPLDFPGHAAVLSARLVHDDLAGRNAQQYFGLASGRWRLGDGAGELGALLGVSLQKRAFREDQLSAGNPVVRTDLVAGRSVVAPNGISQTTSAGQRNRRTANAFLQWRPSARIELFAEGSATEFRTRQDSWQVNAASSPSFVAGSATLFDGTDDLKTITWTNAPVSVLSFARDTFDRTHQVALGGRWTGDALTLSADLSTTQGTSTLFFSGPFMGTTAARFSQDFSTSIPGSVIAGTDLLDPANFQYTGIAYRTSRLAGRLPAVQVDAAYRIGSNFFTALETGVRHATRVATNAPGLIFADAPLTGFPATRMPGAVAPYPFDFFPGSATPTLDNFLVADLSGARDAVGLRNAFGIVTPIPVAANSLGIWRIVEETRSVYGMTRFKAAGAPIDGNLGLRAVQTLASVSSSQSVPGTTSTTPADSATRLSDVLPSVNLRYTFGSGLLLRLAASKTVTRPDFAQLSPSLTLIPNPVNPALNQGSAGNPELRPVRSNNLDLSFENYPGRTTAMTAAAFLKKVDGFVTTVSSPETWGGSTYQISRPQNSDAATIRGIELGYQQFYDFLPGWLGGLGLQATYTFVDSQAGNSSLGSRVPLQNLSKNSANLIGLYERADVSARLAWNWRSRFLSGVTNLVGVGALPVYTRAYGWLDASVGYRVSRTVTLSLVATNLSDTLRKSYFGTQTRPQSNWLGDRQVSAAVTLRL